MSGDVVLAYLNRLRSMTSDPTTLAHIDEIEVQRLEDLVQRQRTHWLDDVVRELGIDEGCHCGAPIDVSEFRNRGMCTHCDDVRCDAYPGACGR